MTEFERLSTALADRYRLERELGAGGMATVYLAEDLRHKRQVAVKVLRQELSMGMGSERFLREIQVAARLQHPHILGVLDSGQADELNFYVMPYVQGETLRERITRAGELPLPAALRILSEVADALSAAHAMGVVHRDIKPENIMLSGRHALVMDFGVAKAVSDAADSHQLTSVGIALGTPTYMAPEQATADPQMDARVDIYALGVVAYEMLTGVTPFRGLSPQQMLAAHVSQVPEPVTSLRPSVPAALAQLVARCLEKRAADRYQSAEELVAAIDPLLGTTSEGTTPLATAPHLAVARTGRPRWVLPVAAMAVAAVALALWLRPRGLAALELGTPTPLAADAAGLKMSPSLSPDGKWIAYVLGTPSRGRIYVRSIDGGRAIALTDDSTHIEERPTYSPDGKQLLFMSDGVMSVTPAQGGRARPVMGQDQVSDVFWGPTADTVGFIRGDTLHVAAFGAPTGRTLAVLPEMHSCRWAPKRPLVACVQGLDNYRLTNQAGSPFGNRSPSRIIVIPAAGGTPRLVSDSVSENLSPSWTVDGTLLYVTERNHVRDVFRVGITSAGAADGAPERVTSGLGVLDVATDATGEHLAYSRSSTRANLWTLPLRLSGVSSLADAKPFTSGDQLIESVSVSPDGKWVLYDSDVSGVSNAYRMPAGGGNPEALTNEQAPAFAPVLSADGKELLVHSWRNGTRDILLVPLDGRAPTMITNTRDQEYYPLWGADGRSLVYMQLVPFRSRLMQRDASGRWVQSRRHPMPAGATDWSRDGRLLLAAADDSLESAVYLGRPDADEFRVLWHGATWPLHAPGRRQARFVARFTRDGAGVVLKSVVADTTTFWHIPIGGGSPRLIARIDDPLRSSSRPDFALDENRIFLALTERQSEVWVTSLRGK